MKKIILLAALAVVFCSKVKAQAPGAPDTTKVISRSEADALFTNTDKALRAIHRVHIDALTRDSIDAYLITNQRFLQGKVPGLPTPTPGPAKTDSVALKKKVIKKALKQ